MTIGLYIESTRVALASGDPLLPINIIEQICSRLEIIQLVDSNDSADKESLTNCCILFDVPIDLSHEVGPCFHLT